MQGEALFIVLGQNIVCHSHLLKIPTVLGFGYEINQNELHRRMKQPKCSYQHGDWNHSESL